MDTHHSDSLQRHDAAPTVIGVYRRLAPVQRPPHDDPTLHKLASPIAFHPCNRQWNIANLGGAEREPDKGDVSARGTMDYRIPVLVYEAQHPEKEKKEAERREHQEKKMGKGVDPTPPRHKGKGKAPSCKGHH